MLHKFKSLLHLGSLPPHPASPEASQDAPQCPFAKNNGEKQPPASMKCPVSGKQVDADSDSQQEEKPRGGCPFMSAGSQKKKNPSLKQAEQGYDEPFVSKFRYYLSTSKINFGDIKKGLPQPSLSRQVFDTYPVYLQHTLFYNGQDYRKVRGLECCSRFMAYEQLREKGNKRYNKGKYYEALDFYERAYSLFKWLEHGEPVNQSTLSSQHLSAEDASLSQTSENGSKVNIPLEDEKIDDPSNAFDELKTKYKQFFITYTDDNTKLCDGDDLTEQADIDMRKSLMIQILLNMCTAYINTHHYSLALQVCEEGIALSDKVSQLYFRKAQVLALNNSSTLEDLKQAEFCIKLAIERRSSEKIFSGSNQNILKMLNIHDAEEAYQQCFDLISKRQTELAQSLTETTKKIHDRVMQINKNQQRIITEGKVPKEGHHKLMQDSTEMKILTRMSNKYTKVVQFYTQAKNQQQVGLAKKQFQEILRINHEVQVVLGAQVEEKEGELGGLQSQKVQRRVDYVKTEVAEHIYNGGRFNFTMLEWAIKEVIKEEKQEQEAKKKAEEDARKQQGGAEVQAAAKPRQTSLLFLLIVVPLIVMLLNMFVL